MTDKQIRVTRPKDSYNTHTHNPKLTESTKYYQDTGFLTTDLDWRRLTEIYRADQDQWETFERWVAADLFHPKLTSEQVLITRPTPKLTEPTSAAIF